ncbi:MAG: NAD(P)H-dependent oxidoreductase [Clostridium sp.]|nr:NAD(P)H-dependent oxidoreductase [Acetatifactor muris]MCM1527283.1 NAD(P)H-dependent oxidoreductase [Bacteroides sp.]MCM1563023.1 NAD(P)H-dependent oxidoreductase [Clostridium sp.]
MNVLVINGSPKGGSSNTYRLTSAFLNGMRQAVQDIRTKELLVSRMDIKSCLGCFSCWNRTPGQCCIQDDMQHVIQEMLWADVTIWSFPLYYYSVPGPLKNLIDRQLPMLLPFMTEKEGRVGNGGHPSRYDMSGKRTVVISTCGFYTAEGNYDGIYSLFDHLCGPGNYTSVFCGQGELFRVSELSARTNEYLSYVNRAGQEFMKDGISGKTRATLNRLLLPRETFEACADASWGIEQNGAKTGSAGKKESDTLIFTRQMAALYRKENYPGKDIVLEMSYTDVDECYQILLGKDGSSVYTDGTLTADTKIETPVTVWRSIAAGEIRGDEAMLQGLYKVKGDFSLMLKWDSLFGGSRPQIRQAETTPPQRNTNMSILLIPWIVLWIAPAIHKQWGCLITLGVCALVPLLYYRNKKTFYDILTNVLVTGVSVIMLAGGSEKWLLPLSYLSFGVMWAASCLGKVPLTANYSMNDYGGEDALQNALFLKTNRILTMLWGVLYLLTSIFTWFLMRTSISSFVGLINSILPVFMGIFTVWFQNRYPAKVAGGR